MHKTTFCSVLHQPWRISKFSFFDIGQHKKYFDDRLNKYLFKRISRKSYIPTLKLMKDLCEDTEFKVNLSITGTFFQQAEIYEPKVIKLLKKLNETDKLELIGETFYHSLAFLISPEEFKSQVLMHRKLLKDVFNYKAKIFRNTESMYNDDVANSIEKLKFKGIITEGSDSLLGWRDPGYPYQAGNTSLQLFMRNYKLSDDIAFRFSSRDWKEYPLTSEKYASWLKKRATPHTLLFIDFETFGEHQWEDTGVFEFLKYLPEKANSSTGVKWTNLSELFSKTFKAKLKCPNFVSWADMDRDLSAWLGNDMQNSAFKFLKELELSVKQTQDKNLLEVWRRLTTSDHLYYLSTKFAGDEEVHSYFREEAHASPYEAFTNYMNILQDLRSLVNKKLSLAKS